MCFTGKDNAGNFWVTKTMFSLSHIHVRKSEWASTLPMESRVTLGKSPSLELFLQFLTQIFNIYTLFFLASEASTTELYINFFFFFFFLVCQVLVETNGVSCSAACGILVP